MQRHLEAIKMALEHSLSHWRRSTRLDDDNRWLEAGPTGGRSGLMQSRDVTWRLRHIRSAEWGAQTQPSKDACTPFLLGLSRRADRLSKTRVGRESNADSAAWMP